MTTQLADSLEAKAIAFGESWSNVKKRILQFRSCLRKDYLMHFKPGRFVRAEKALYSDNGTYKLQWQLREYPNEPESYNNQQTSCGTVVLYRIMQEKIDDSRIPA